MNENNDLLTEAQTAAADSKQVHTGKVMIAALGGSGANTLNALAVLPGNKCETLLLETDSASASHCTATHVLCGNADWNATRGQGCGGDPMKGERAFARERAKLTQLLEGNDFVIVTGGLGGGTATGGVRTVASVLRQLSIPAVYVLTTPFSFESYSKHSRAAQCLHDLRDVTDVLITLPNDLLFSMLPPETEAPAAFCQASAELAETIFGLSELFRGNKMFGSDFAEFAALLKKNSNTCAFGCGHAAADDGLDRCSIALERMLESPFLGGMDKLNSCSAVMVTMTGGEDLQFAEMKRTLENFLSLLPAGIQVSTGISINPDYKGNVQISALAIQYEQETAPEKPEHFQETLWATVPGSGKNASSGEQGLLNLQTYSKGIFSDRPPVKYHDEDLDIPTFQRRGVSIDKGSTTK